MRKGTMRACFLIFGFLSLSEGYFKVPGMEKLDTPYDHLFRGGPSNVEQWDDMPPMVKKDFKWTNDFPTPQVHSFYHKLEGKYEPFVPDFYNPHSAGRFYRPSGYSNNLSELNRLTSLMSEPVVQSERTNKAEQRVVGGRDVGEGEIPWQVRQIKEILSHCQRDEKVGDDFCTFGVLATDKRGIKGITPEKVDEKRTDISHLRWFNY